MKTVILLLALIFTTGCLQGQREHGLATNAATTVAERALGEAIKEGDLQEVRSIIEQNPLYDLKKRITVEKDGGGNVNLTPLQIAAAWGKLDIVTYLLANCRDRLDIDAQTAGSGRTALHLAAENNYDEVAKMLIDHGANKDIQDNKGTPLHRAVISESKRVVRCLIEQGIDATIKNRDGKTALELAKEKEHAEIIKLIERYEIEFRIRRALGDDEFERIKSTLERANYRANNPVNDQGHNLLYHAAAAGWQEVVRILVETEEEENLKSAIDQEHYNHSPLYTAVEKGNTELVKLLIYGRAASNHRRVANQEEEIEREAVRGREAIVKKLKNQEGRTLLHVAAAKGYERIVRLLVEFMAIGAEEYENSQADPVHQDHMMRELAYVSQVDNNGTTAESLAREARSTSIANFLKKARKGIAKRRKKLDKDAYVLSGYGGGVTVGVPAVVTAGINLNRAHQTPAWSHKRRGLIIEARKIWRHKDNRLWQKLAGNDSAGPFPYDESIPNQRSWAQQRRCCF